MRQEAQWGDPRSIGVERGEKSCERRRKRDESFERE
jgi:hypothetical protein